MKRRVLFVIADVLPLGAGEQAILTGSALREHFEIDVFSLSRGWRRSDFANWFDGWTEYDAGRWNWLGAARRLRSQLKSKPYSIIHSWDWRSTSLVRGVLSGCRPTNRSCKWIVQADDRFAFQSPSIDDFLPAAKRQNWTVRDPWQANAAYDSDRSTSIPRIAIPVPARNDWLRSEFGLPQSVKIIGTTCPLEARFGLKHLIWAIDQIKCVRDDLRLVVWGTGSFESALRRYAGLVGVANWIYWRSPRSDIRREMAGLDLYWHAPRDEALTASLVTALLLGLPAIAARNEATAELARHWPTTLATVTWGARDEIARQTQQWLKEFPSHPPESAAQNWTRQHSPASVAVEYRQIYDRLLAE